MNIRKLLPRRRFWVAAGLAWTATFVSVGLAVLPGWWVGGSYNPELAVLTATLLALIWSAYLTHKAVNNEPVSRVGLTMALSPEGCAIGVTSNGQHDLWVRPSVTFFSVLGERLAERPLAGDVQDEVMLVPGDGFPSSAALGALRAELAGLLTTIVVTIRVEWRDAVKNRGVREEIYAIQADGQAGNRLFTAHEQQRAKRQIVEAAG